MSRSFVLTVWCLTATAAFAQETPPRRPAEGVISYDSHASYAATPAAAVQTTPPPVRSRTRRPSMVGYVDDSTVETSLRVRYDLGFDVAGADRAEFFYGKCGCYRDLPADSAFFDPAAAGPGPGILTSLDYRQLYLTGQFGFLSDRASVLVELPIRTIKPQSFQPGTDGFGDASGLGDMRVGAKASLVARTSRQATFQFQATLPTGDSRKGLGTDHVSLEPSLLYREQFSDRLGVEAEFGEVLPVGGSAGIPTDSSEKFSGKVLYYGVGPHFVVYHTPAATLAPVVELVGWHVLDGFQTLMLADAGGIDIVNLKIGGRVGLRNGSSFYVGYGKALTDARWYDDIVRFEYRVGF